MLLGLPDRKLLTKFQLPSALSNILLLMPEECKGGNGEKMQWRNVFVLQILSVYDHCPFFLNPAFSLNLPSPLTMSECAA